MKEEEGEGNEGDGGGEPVKGLVWVGIRVGGGEELVEGKKQDEGGNEGKQWREEERG
ncbi:hypothetical protein [Neisseria sicca]|uniref:hypothetical protein n=1 Tax=Neisseria sicca TaxID=490 RepID=UPI0016499BA4|nr:hypothetical protein [Neisseria sicca]